jgi:hypothetical protein
MESDKENKNNLSRGYIGSILMHKPEIGKPEAIAIYDIYQDVPNTVECVDYPIPPKSEIRRNSFGISKEQRKSTIEELVNLGDWMYMGQVNTFEEEELEDIRLSKKPRNLIE